mgnify:CR=1 FL=1|tara:strand:- start:736 stop:2124 length:1389 start_codon:yes stop_codon:yes gene_type:complete
MAINRHGVPKDATKAELKKIRATGSPGAKKLAHWKLNMHHNTEAVDDIKQRLQAKSNRVKDALMAKKMQKVAFRHRTDEQKLPMISPGLEMPDMVNVKNTVKKKKDEKWAETKQHERPRQPQTMGEDARYKASMGPGSMEWGTDVGDNYYRSLTPGQTPTDKKALLKPLPIKAIKPEDVKARLRQKIREDFDIGHIEDRQADHTKHQYPIDNEIDAQWKSNIDGILTGAYEGGKITMKDVEELDYEAEHYSFEDAVEDGLYDPDELMAMDFDGDEYNDINITEEVQLFLEALSVQGRMKRRFAARRNRQKLRVARRIALRRGSTPDRLKRRAVRGARLMVYKRLLRGRDRAGLPPAEKARLERMITRFQPLVNRISVKLLPQMRRNEIKRLTNRGKGPQRAKKYKAAKPIKGAASYKAKRYKIKAKPFKAKYKAKPVSRIKSGGPTLKKASRAYKAFSYSVG